MPLPADNVSKGIVFLGCPVCPFVCLFVWSDFITTISREWLEHCLWTISIKLTGSIH